MASVLSVSIVFILFFGLVSGLVISSTLNISILRSILIFLWHSFFSVFYAFYVLEKGGDAIWYFNQSSLDGVIFSFGTGFIIWFTSIFTVYFGFDFISTNLMFGFIGFVGLILFDRAFVTLSTSKNNLIIKWFLALWPFIPSVSFWSSGLGKDSISFFCVGLIAYSLTSSRIKFFSLLFAILVMFLIREHVALIIVFSLLVAYIISSKFHFPLKFIYLSFLSFLTWFVLGYLFSVIGFDFKGIDSFSYFLDLKDRVGNFSGYNSTFDPSSYSLLHRAFLYLFHPLEFSGFLITLVSIENVLLLGFLCYMLFRFDVGRFSINDFNTVYFLLFFFLMYFANVLITVNLGVAVRQKWVFVLYLYMFLISNLRSPSRNRRVMK